MGKVVEGIDVLQQTAVFEIPDAAGGTGGIKTVGRFASAGIEGIIVLGLIDADAPQEDGRVIPILLYHLPGIFYSLCLPRLVTDVLPAGDFREDQNAQLIAAVKEVVGLGVMGGAHGVEAQLVFDQVSIPFLHGFRHGVAHIGIALMPVKATELCTLAIYI